MRKLVSLLAAALAALALSAAAFADTPGVTSSSILIGGTAPLSGEASSAAAVSKGAEAYFNYVNSKGGVNGRKITYKILDDGYDPGRAVQAVRQLVQQDNVFALFNTLGTNSNLAIRDFLNQSQVPQVFVAAGANAFGADYKKYPWTIGFIPNYGAEAVVLARHLLKTKPKAKIAVLYQDDDYGHDLLNGLKRGLGAAASQIASAVGYDPTAADVSSQVAQLKASGADTLFLFAFGKFAVQGYLYLNKLGWHPQVFVNAVASSANLMTLSTITSSKQTTDGSISIAFGKDPTDSRWAKDPGLALYKRIMKQFVPGGNVKDGYYIAGMASAYSLVDALKRAGKDLTRAGLMKAVTSLNETDNPFLITGIAVRTSPTDYFPVQQMQLQRWQNGRWVAFGDLVTTKS